MTPRLEWGRSGDGPGTDPSRLTPFIPTIALLALLTACGKKDEPDAYGNFEATEVVVSAETGGQLLWFTPEEGKRLAAGVQVALVDTTSLDLERRQIVAQRAATGSRATEVGANVDVLVVQRDIAQRNYERMRRLFAQQAATAKELDQAERDYRVLVQQIEAAQAQRRTATRDVTASDARVAEIKERIAKSRVVNPVTGTVLVTYTEAGEVVQQGQPLYKVANTDSLIVRAYVGETQLAHVKLGQTAQVSVDVAEGKRVGMPGVVAWISPEAEFTPTPIQTRDERADLVYAVKIRVANPKGVAKIGMPADVRFAGVNPETP